MTNEVVPADRREFAPNKKSLDSQPDQLQEEPMHDQRNPSTIPHGEAEPKHPRRRWEAAPIVIAVAAMVQQYAQYRGWT